MAGWESRSQSPDTHPSGNTEGFLLGNPTGPLAPEKELSHFTHFNALLEAPVFGVVASRGRARCESQECCPHAAHAELFTEQSRHGQLKQKKGLLFVGSLLVASRAGDRWCKRCTQTASGMASWRGKLSEFGKHGHSRCSVDQGTR
jgi:hypothetical protein